MGTRLLAVLTFLCSLLVYRDNCIYTICQESADACYVYDYADNIYLYSDGDYIPLEGSCGVTAKPALTYIPLHMEYNLIEEQPHCYVGTFRDACAFITALTDDGFDLSTNYRDFTRLDIVLNNQSISVRCIVTSDEHVRVYTENPDDFFQISAYINGDTTE